MKIDGLQALERAHAVAGQRLSDGSQVVGVQDIGAQQTGMSVEAFKAKLVDAGR